MPSRPASRPLIFRSTTSAGVPRNCWSTRSSRLPPRRSGGRPGSSPSRRRCGSVSRAATSCAPIAVRERRPRRPGSRRRRSSRRSPCEEIASPSMTQTRRLTMAQALIECLAQQYTSLDGLEQPFFGGVLTIFGHGNVAGVGQALLQAKDRIRCYLPRNEQAMVHTAVGFAKMANRKRAMICTSSIGPGATNMITGAALATINRLPVLLLPGDIFATRGPAPVLQQLERSGTPDVSVNDCFKPVSRYWDRINRPEQLIASLPEALRVLTSPAETGTVTLCLPQDVQTEAYDYPEELFRKRVWVIPRQRPDAARLREAAALLRQARTPMIIAGGGAIYSEATGELARFAAATGIPVVETMAGKGTLPFDHPQALGAIGVTGAPGPNRLAIEADVVIAIGTRLS